MTVAAGARRTYLDVLRGVAVLIMIEAHVIDSWTRPSDRSLRGFGESLILGGFGAPLFLFLAGIGVAMSAGSKARRVDDPAAAAWAVQKRGLQIFALALLFRLQSYSLSLAPAWTMLKVDILNILGLTMIAAAALWALARGVRGRILVFAVATGVLVFVAPLVRSLPWLAALPDWLEAYIRPVPGMTNFAFFPWSGFLMAGAILGVILDAARTANADRRANLAFGIGGLALAVAAYQASFLPPLHPRSSFWTTSASFFFLRLGLMMAALGLAWLWEQRSTAGRRWSPLQTMGRSSLFIYWVHVELVYGLVAYPVKGAFSFAGAWAALGVFCLFMLWLTVWKDRIVGKYRDKRDLRLKLDRRVQALMF
jgi:uncharacterized membrane protein